MQDETVGDDASGPLYPTKKINLEKITMVALFCEDFGSVYSTRPSTHLYDERNVRLLNCRVHEN